MERAITINKVDFDNNVYEIIIGPYCNCIYVGYKELKELRDKINELIINN